MADVDQALRLSPAHDAGLAVRAGMLAVKGDRSDPRFRASARTGAPDNQPDRIPGTRRLCDLTGAKTAFLHPKFLLCSNGLFETVEIPQSPPARRRAPLALPGAHELLERPGHLFS
jgi:hypothetical protein